MHLNAEVLFEVVLFLSSSHVPPLRETLEAYVINFVQTEQIFMQEGKGKGSVHGGIVKGWTGEGRREKKVTKESKETG